MNCPYCNEPMELIRDGKYYWHKRKASNFRNPKAMTCPITSVVPKELDVHCDCGQDHKGRVVNNESSLLEWFCPVENELKRDVNV